ncbi:hypothetical protein ACRTC3_11570 [Photobacterium damselae]|uniref:hypothetical protein n=1 Tax=Photobacterium damselae TaxID=38293 RepID=UPI003D7D6350
MQKRDILTLGYHSLEQQNKAFEQLEDALDDIDELTERMGLIQQELNALKTKYELSENNRQNAEQANTELKHQVSINEKQLSELQSKNQELEQKNTQLNTQLVSAQKEIDSLNTNSISSAQTVQNLEKLNAKLDGQLQLITSSLDQSKQELTNNNQTILSLEKLKTEHTTLINSMQNAIKEKNQELEGQRVRVDRLIEENTNLIKNTPM